MKKLALTSAFAIAVAFCGAAHAQTQGFQKNNWNEVQVTNCWLTPPTPASGTTTAQPTTLHVDVNIITAPPNPSQPPPIPDTGEFVVTDSTLVAFASPWCKSTGGLFFVFMDANNNPQYFSTYPR